MKKGNRKVMRKCDGIPSWNSHFHKPPSFETEYEHEKYTKFGETIPNGMPAPSPTRPRIWQTARTWTQPVLDMVSCSSKSSPKLFRRFYQIASIISQQPCSFVSKLYSRYVHENKNSISAENFADIWIWRAGSVWRDQTGGGIPLRPY